MISIIVPVYNSERNLKNCIESILSQDFTDFELLLIDDGSSDNSGKICDSYAEKDDRIKVFHIPNGGVSAARNRGIKESSGDYIMFCDSDDTVEKDWCQLLFETISKNRTAWISSGLSKVLVESKIENVILLNNDTEISECAVDDYYAVYKTGTSGYIWNKIYEAKTVKSNNIFFPEDTDYAEDALFNNKYLKYCDKIIFINKSLYNYYIAEGFNNLSNKYFADFYDKVKPVYLSRKELITEKYLADFCYDYFYYFNKSLQGTFDKRNKLSFLKKIKYNNYIINDKVFKDCISKMTKKDSDTKYVSMLNNGSYMKIYLFEKLSSLKRFIKK